MIVAWRNLTRDRARVLTSADGMGFAVLLILLPRGLFAGITDASTRFVRGIDRHTDAGWKTNPAAAPRHVASVRRHFLDLLAAPPA